MMPKVMAFALAFAAAGAAPVSAQCDSTRSSAANLHAHHRSAADVTALVETVHAAVQRYRDRSAAIRDGYRRAGRDIPAMGQHWLNPTALVRSSFDIRKPAILTYIEVDGAPMLTGAVLAAALQPGASPPEVVGAAGWWHEHNGFLDDESVAAHTADAPASEARLAVLHVWTELRNPDGLFAAENWALPFARMGLPVPSCGGRDAARALSLLAFSDYYVDAARVAGADSAYVAAAAGARHAAIARIADSVATRGIVDAPAVAALAAEWLGFVTDLRAVCPACAIRLSPPD